MSDRLEDLIDEWGRHFEPATHVTGRYGMPKTGEVTDWQMTLTKDGWKYHKADLIQALQSYINTKVIETVNLNRIELAKDIKHRHWANDALRDAYLDAVISVSEETLAELKLKGEKI